MNNSDQIRSYAEAGAAIRYKEIATEMAAIRSLFPNISNPSTASQPVVAGQRKRRTFTPAERKATSLRMKAYWLARKKQAAKPVKRRAKKVAKPAVDAVVAAVQGIE